MGEFPYFFVWPYLGEDDYAERFGDRAVRLRVSNRQNVGRGAKGTRSARAAMITDTLVVAARSR